MKNCLNLHLFLTKKRWQSKTERFLKVTYNK